MLLQLMKGWLPDRSERCAPVGRASSPTFGGTLSRRTVLVNEFVRSPVVDAGLARLGNTDRAAVTMRYLQSKSVAEEEWGVAAALPAEFYRGLAGPGIAGHDDRG